METLARVTVYAYFVVLALLSVYGIHRYFILFLYLKHHKFGPKRKKPYLAISEYPTVTIQLPLYNEYYVARRAILAAGQMRYPRHLLRIQVLDDSTDGTREVAQETVGELHARGLNAEYRHRAERAGFKAGALKQGLDETPDELVAVFDADFVPPPDFLERTVAYFQDPAVGMVQTRWGYLNRDYSLLTRAQAILLDGHFVLEHTARAASARFFNFNGTGGIFRRCAILDSGNWQPDTLTEDLDLSYRAQLNGWRFVFLPEVQCASELPVDMLGFKNQQHRWTKGCTQVGRKLLRTIWKSPVPLRVKLEATIHLTANLAYLLLLLLSILMPLSVMFRGQGLSGVSLVWESLILAMTTVSLSLFYAISQHESHPEWKCRLPDIPLTLALGVGMCVNNAWAVVEALVGHETPFVRTAKYRIENLQDQWKGKIYRSLRKPSSLLEPLLAAYMLATAVVSALLQQWATMPYALLFVAGYAYVFVLSFDTVGR